MKHFEQSASKKTEGHLNGIFTRKVSLKGSWVLCAIVLVLNVGVIVTGCNKDKKPTIQEQELSLLRSSIARFKLKNDAIAAGYNVDVTGYRTHMGHHFLNGNLVDNKFEIDKPEVMLYAPYGSDTARLVAVEYVTPVEDLNNPPPVPKGFTGNNDVWEINTEFKLWTLHVWVGLDNADGIFAPHNHKLP